MKKTAITVTEAARNFADCVSRVYYQRQSFVLLKNGKALARLVPEAEKVCTGKELAEILGRSRLSAEEARAWRQETAKARKNLKAPKDKWQ